MGGGKTSRRTPSKKPFVRYIFHPHIGAHYSVFPVQKGTAEQARRASDILRKGGTVCVCVCVRVCKGCRGV